MRIKVIVALAHAQREQQAVAVVTEAEAVIVVHGFGKVLNAAVCIIGVIIDDNYIHAAAVALGKLRGRCLKLLLLICAQQADIVNDIAGAAGRGRIGRAAKGKAERDAEDHGENKSFLHIRSPLLSRTAMP